MVMNVAQLIAGSALLMAIGCAQPTSGNDGEAVASSRHALIRGVTTSGAEQAAVVALGYNGNGKWEFDCTGVVIAPRLVLTSRICVGSYDANTNTFTDVPATAIGVYSGANGAEKAKLNVAPGAVGTQLFVPATRQWAPAVAVLMVNVDLEAAPAALRLGASVKQDEAFTVAGFGYDEKNSLSSVREQRGGLSVLAIGPSSTENLAAGEFMSSESLCLGDQGAPAFSNKTKAVIGIGVEYGNDVTNGTAISSTCVGSGTRTYFNDLPSAKEVIDRAFAAAGGAPRLEEAAQLNSTHVPTEGEATPDGDGDDGVDINGDGEGENGKAEAPPINSAGCSAAPRGTEGAPLAGILATIGAMLLLRRRDAGSRRA